MNTTTLSISGMNCQGCASSVHKALSVIKGVSDVKVDLEAGKATMFHDPVVVPVEKLVEAVEDAGFEARYTM